MKMIDVKMALVITAGLLAAGCSVSEEDLQQVKVFQSDASVQCESEGVAPAEMQKVLTSANIDVQCAQKGHTGMMHTTVCGAPTGNVNVYTIDASKIAEARTLGFAPVTELPEYQDEACGN